MFSQIQTAITLHLKKQNLAMKIKVGIGRSISGESICLGTITNKTDFWNYRNILTVFSTFCLSVAVVPNHLIPSEINSQSVVFAQSTGTNYGLGLPKTASTGGGTRLVNPDEGRLRGGRSYSRPRNPIPSAPNRVNNQDEPSPPGTPSKTPSKKIRQLPLLTLITPEDGGRTASSQPVLYWYLNDPSIQVFTSPSKPRRLFNSANNAKSPLNGKLSVTAGDSDTIAFFETDLKINYGLSRFKLPSSAALKPAQPYRWQIKLQDRDGADVIASGWIVYTPPEEALSKSLLRTLTSRDRAKIYAQAGYWFEAIDGYTQWLNFKPSDLDARRARNQVLNLGFATNTNFDFETFKKVLNANRAIN
jgi:hypothetical protein